MLIPAGGRPTPARRLICHRIRGRPERRNKCFLPRYDLGHPSGQFRLFVVLAYRAEAPPRAFIFHNRTYTPENILETKVDLNWLRLSYGYKLWDFLFCGWPPAGVHHIRNTTTINGVTEEEGLASNTRSLDGTYPVLGLETRVLLPHGIDFGLELEGTHLITRGFLTNAAVERTVGDPS